MNYKQYLGIFVAVLVGVAIYGGYQYPKVSASYSGTNTAGATFNSAKFAGVVIAASTPGSNGTSTSILNTDATDRYITEIKVGCQAVGTSAKANAGTGLANNGWNAYIATTTTSAPASISNSLAMNIILSTSTPVLMIASSTVQNQVVATTSAANIWTTGSYLTFFLNATNTATCTFGASYFGS